MGWWDTIWDTIKGWGTALYNSPTAKQKAKDFGRFTYDTTLYTVELLTVAPLKAGYKIINNEKSRRMASHIGRITVEDILPMVTFAYMAEDVIKSYAQDYYEEDNPDPSPIRPYLLLLLPTIVTVTSVANSIYQKREKIKTTVRFAAVTLENGGALDELNANEMALCDEEKCNWQRRLQGSVRDLVSFYLTEGAISLIRMAPWGGNSAAAVLSVYHHGNYIMGLVVPLCERHRVIYKIEHPELVLAAGLSQAILSLVVSETLELTTGVPALYYRNFVDQITLFMSTFSATQLRLPAPVAKTTRPMLDPVVIFQRGTGLIFDTFAKGLKAQIKPMIEFFKQPPSDIPWDKIFLFIKKTWGSDYAELIKSICLPLLIRSGVGFKKDPIIAPNWEDYRLGMIWVIGIIEQIKNEYPVSIQLAKKYPKQAAGVLNSTLGLNKALAELLIKIIGNSDSMVWLSDKRRQLEGMSATDAPFINPTPDAWGLRNPSSPMITEVEEIDAVPGIPVSDVIRDQPQEPGFLSARNVIFQQPQESNLPEKLTRGEDSNTPGSIPDEGTPEPSSKKKKSESVYNGKNVIFNSSRDKDASSLAKRVIQSGARNPVSVGSIIGR